MIEIIAATVEDAINAQQGGADRIELVSALSEGGLTPSYGLIKGVIEAVTIPVNVMIRPHSKSFVYTDHDLKAMALDIQMAKELGANGVVYGLLTSEKALDKQGLEQLIAVSDGLDITFHRAIDEQNPVAMMKILATYKEITTVLTSGGLLAPIDQNTAIINHMIEEAGHIQVLLGGGLNGQNISAIAKSVNTQNFHFGTAVQTSGEVVAGKVASIKRQLQEGK